MAAVVGALLPERAILVDEALTSGVGLAELTSGAPRHDWLCLTGGAIGDGLPMALGAAVACPDRPVIGIQADGSAMYTISALWSYAREQADITTIVCDNGSYAILQHELSRVGAASDGERAGQLLDLGGPSLDFVALATGHGRAGDPGDHRGGAGRPAAARAGRARPAPDRRGAGARLSRWTPGWTPPRCVSCRRR